MIVISCEVTKLRIIELKLITGPNQSSFMTTKITRSDLAKLKDFIKSNKSDKDAPIVWIAEIIEILAREEYYKHYKP